MHTCLLLFRISGAVGRIVLKFAIWVEISPAMRVIQAMDGVSISACAQFWGSRQHSAEIWCVPRPFNYESCTAMSKVYLMSASATAHLFMLIYSPPPVHRPKGVLLVK